MGNVVTLRSSLRGFHLFFAYLEKTIFAYRNVEAQHTLGLSLIQDAEKYDYYYFQESDDHSA